LEVLLKLFKATRRNSEFGKGVFSISLQIQNSVKVEAVKVLTDLGFTATQARAYFALCQNGISDAKTISKESRIARQDVYRVLAGLEEMGFIEKTLTKPAMFKAVPLQETIDALIRRQKEESHNLWEKTQVLLKQLEKNQKASYINEKPQFILIPEGTAYISKGREAIKTAESSIDCITSSKRFLKMLRFAGEDIVKALEKGVNFRFLLVRSTMENSLPRIIKKYYDASLCDIKYFASECYSQARIAIYDRREVHIAISTNENFMKSSMLLSTYQPLVSVICDYFETVWSEQSRNLESDWRENWS
jgi:sugar-specific transcriptional regulator TrmB